MKPDNTFSRSTNHIRVLLIGGTSHVGKSTLGKYLATKLGWEYLSTDSLARHPGRPWVSKNNRTIKQHVVEHYKNLSTPDLLADVLKHYAQNVLPQVETLVQARRSNLSNKCLIIEGSALYPSLVRDLITLEDVKGIWLAGNYDLLKNRIYQNSNFDRVGKKEQYLISKFLERTRLYNQAMLNESRNLGFTCIHVN